MEAFSTQLSVLLYNQKPFLPKWREMRFFYNFGLGNYRYAALLKNEWEKPLKLCIFQHPKANIEAVFKASQKARKYSAPNGDKAQSSCQLVRKLKHFLKKMSQFD